MNFSKELPDETGSPCRPRIFALLRSKGFIDVLSVPPPVWLGEEKTREVR